MGKIVTHFAILVASFFACWWILHQLDWMKIFHVDELGQSTEEKLGELYWEIYSKLEKEETDTRLIGPVDSLLTHICKENNIDRDLIKLHLIDKDEINAFALPDHHMVLYTGLIRDCENEAELCGVMAHELAHMESGHIMKKLVKEIGFSVLISMTTGNGSPEIIQQAVKILSSTAYDRSLESEADIIGVDYLINADINPEAFAHFLYRMSAAEKDLPDKIFWITTHPGSEERMKAIMLYIADKEYGDRMVLDSMTWVKLVDEIVKHAE